MLGWCNSLRRRSKFVSAIVNLMNFLFHRKNWGQGSFNNSWVALSLNRIARFNGVSEIIQPFHTRAPAEELVSDKLNTSLRYTCIFIYATRYKTFLWTKFSDAHVVLAYLCAQSSLARHNGVHTFIIMLRVRVPCQSVKDSRKFPYKKKKTSILWG